MRTPTQQTRGQAHRGVALFIATLTILIALVALAPLNGVGQPFGQSPRAGNRLPAKGSVSRSSQPSSPLFLPAVPYDSGGINARSVAVADIDGDRKLDLVVANSGSGSTGTVGVLLGNGDGTFRPTVNYSSGGNDLPSVAVADVNGDGKPDLLVSNRCPIGSSCTKGTVGVLLGNGDGTFQSAVSYNSGGSEALSVAVSDINGDGKLDLVVANYGSDAVGVLLGNGDGTFQSAISYGSGGQGPISVAVAEVNGDHKPDLLVLNQRILSAVGVLLGNGDGTFQSAVSYNSGGFAAQSVAVSDINGDGKPDLVVANECLTAYACSGILGVLLGNGDGTFQAATTYDSGGFAADSVAIADVNNDGKPDLVVANYCASSNSCANGSVGVLLGKGDGTFQRAVAYGSRGEITDFVAVADLNGDGKADLLAVSDQGSFSDGHGAVAVLMNNTGVHSPTSTSFTSSLNPSIYGQKVTWTATVTSSGSFMPTGKVKFTWSGNTIGSATLNTSGVATLNKSNLNAVTYPLTAVYAGDADNLGSTSTILNQVVLQATSSATLTSLPNPSTQGRAVTFTAKISSPTVTPRGPVTFTAGKTVLGTAQLISGKATLNISSLSVGSTKVTATYYGNSNIAKSSASVIQTVQ